MVFYFIKVPQNHENGWGGGNGHILGLIINGYWMVVIVMLNPFSFKKSFITLKMYETFYIVNIL
jgi:hypothetical protein